MKRISLLTAASVLILTAASSHAQTLTGSLSDAAGDVVNLNLGTAAFAAYPNITAFGVGDPITDVGNLANFSSAVGGLSGVSTDSQISVSYIGVDTNTNLPATATNDTSFINTQSSFSLSTSLLAPTETLNFYLGTYQSMTTLTATLSGANVTGTPTYTETSLFNEANGNNGYALLTLTVSGAAIGDVLTFTEAAASPYGNTGLQAVTVDAVPEPSTYALMLGGVAALFLISRFRKLA